MEGIVRTKNIHIQTVKNPFIVEPDEIIPITVHEWDTLLDVRKKYYPADVPCVVVRNGEIIPEDKLSLCFPAPGDQIAIVPEIFGGRDGKQILGAILMIVVAIAAPYAAAAILGTTVAKLGLGGMLLAGAIASVGGLLINTLLPPPKPTLSGAGIDTSQAYGWNPQPTQQAGIPLPMVFGTHKIETPNIIATYIEYIKDKQYINILMCSGIGPVKRLYDFKINDQPYENFKGVEIYTRLGHLNQAVINNFNDTKTEYSLSVKITKDNPYTYLTVGNSFDALEVDITFPQGLYYANNKGGLDSYSVDVKVEIRRQGDTNWRAITSQVVKTQRTVYISRWSAGRWDYDSDGNSYWYEFQAGDSNKYSHYNGEYYDSSSIYWWRWIETSYVETVSETVDYITISGAKASTIRRTLKVQNLSHGKYEIRVTNLTADKTSSRYGDDMYFTAVREVYYDDFEYPNQVLVAVKALATDQLSGSIRVSWMQEGIMVRIYNPSTQTWRVDASSNPAWIAYHLLTKPIYDNNLNVLEYEGFDPSRLILQDFVDLANYCDELVPDGRGGYEKRCTFNGIFDSSQSTWSAVLQVLQLARAVPVWNGIKIGIAIDKKIGTSELDGITQVFGMGNIAKDSFRESWSSSSQRAAVLQADYIDADMDYKRTTATRANRNIPSNNSIRIPLFGATKTSQVWRELDFRLEKNEKLCNTVKIDAGIEAIRCTIGDKVGLSHDVPQWGYSGRILSATANTVTLDREVTIQAGKSYVILIQQQNDAIELKTVANAAGTYSTLQVSTPFASIPDPYCNYSFGESISYIKPFKVIGISPHDDYKKRTLTLIEYNGSIYDRDYKQITLPTPNYSSIDPMPSVTNIKLDELLIRGKDGSITDTINIYFNPPPSYFYKHAEIWYNTGGGWIYSGISQTGTHTIENVEVNKTYQIAVLTVNAIGSKQSIQNAPKASIYTLGKLDPPSNVTNFTAKQNGQFIDFRWDHIPDADLWGYEIRMGINWESARIIADGIQQNSFSWQAELNGTYRFLIKALDDSNNYSLSVASVDITITGINEKLNIILSQDEMTKASPADGTKTNFVYINDYHALMMPHTLTDTDVPAWVNTTAEITNYKGNINTYAEYITNAIDTFKDTDTWIRVQEAIYAIDTGATDQSYPDRTDRTYPGDTDMHVTMPTNYSIWYQVSDDNITYSAWKQYFGLVQENFRYIKVKFIIDITTQTGRFKLLNFLLSFDVPSVNKIITDLAIAASTGTDITFSDYGLNLYTTPIVRTFIKNATGSRSLSVSNLTATGCHIDIFDAANAKVAGTVDLEITGY